MRTFFVVCVLFFISLIACFGAKSENITIDYFLSVINSRQSSWRAGKYFRGNTTNKTVTRSYKKIVFAKDPAIPIKPCYLYGITIPDTFDARTQWPECADITGRVGSQGFCNSCWAFAATGVMADRLCIQTGGKVKFHFSPEDLISCCEYCDSGCTVGKPWKAWDYYTRHGIVSGGGFSSFQGCKPYQESEYMYNKSSKCTNTCYNPQYNIPYAEDKQFGSEFYLVHSIPACIQAEIMKNGPVQAMMAYYEDFAFYKDGVYFYTAGKRKSTHSVKILGWGTERGIPYWLAANSWGCMWGNLNGFFKIRRGFDECAIEQYVIAGNPKLNDTYILSVDNVQTQFRSNYVLPISLGILGFIVLAIIGGLMFHEKSRKVVLNIFFT